MLKCDNKERIAAKIILIYLSNFSDLNKKNDAKGQFLWEISKDFMVARFLADFVSPIFPKRKGKMYENMKFKFLSHKKWTLK